MYTPDHLNVGSLPDNYITTKTLKDCVVVGLANYFNKSYETVLADLDSFVANHLTQNHHTKGYNESAYVQVLRQYLGREPIRKIPRRGQDRMTGLCRFTRQNAKAGHMAVIVAGLVFDYDGTITPIAEYRARFNYHLRSVWL